LFIGGGGEEDEDEECFWRGREEAARERRENDDGARAPAEKMSTNAHRQTETDAREHQSHDMTEVHAHDPSIS
jgi:hypothetical protein